MTKTVNKEENFEIITDTFRNSCKKMPSTPVDEIFKQNRNL